MYQVFIVRDRARSPTAMSGTLGDTERAPQLRKDAIIAKKIIGRRPVASLPLDRHRFSVSFRRSFSRFLGARAAVRYGEGFS